MILMGTLDVSTLCANGRRTSVKMKTVVFYNNMMWACERYGYNEITSTFFAS